MSGSDVIVGVAACWSDLEAAQRLAERLCDEGLTARLICAGAAPGDDGACGVVVALWSPAAATSLWVRRAAAEAAEKDRLVEVALTGDATPNHGPVRPMRLHDTNAAAARVAERVRRCVGAEQGQPALAFAGRAVIAAAAAAAIVGPFLWLANQEREAANLAETEAMQQDAFAESALPPPTPRDAPSDPEPRGNGQGGPLIEKAP